jgi:transketolase
VSKNDGPQGETPIISELIAKRARIKILQMAHAARASHVGSALSVVDILAVLYSGILNIEPGNAASIDRDSVILSKGHSAAALYAVLAIQDFFPESLLDTYYQDGGVLGGHVTHEGKRGVELSTGSLGHGLPYGVGIALSHKLANRNSRTVVVISDGECNEGTTWESALFAQQFQLNSLCVIIDRNRIQSLAPTEDTMALEPFAAKWKAFNWEVITLNGHSHQELKAALVLGKKPLCIIADTKKGNGVSFMENSVLWHYRPPNDQELVEALVEIDI